jgi:hypothetical protein
MPVDFDQPIWEAAKYPGRHVAPVGAQAGARELAANVYELDPGAVGSPLHVTTPTRSYCSSSPGPSRCAVRTGRSSCRLAR